MPRTARPSERHGTTTPGSAHAANTGPSADSSTEPSEAVARVASPYSPTAAAAPGTVAAPS